MNARAVIDLDDLFLSEEEAGAPETPVARSTRRPYERAARVAPLSGAEIDELCTWASDALEMARISGLTHPETLAARLVLAGRDDGSTSSPDTGMLLERIAELRTLRAAVCTCAESAASEAKGTSTHNPTAPANG